MGNHRRAQSFTILGSYTALFIKVKIYKEGSPTDAVKIQLCSDSSGNPGTVLATGTVDASSLTTTPTVFQINLDLTVPLTAGTTYYVVFDRTGAQDATNFYFVSGQSTNTYTNGHAYVSTSSTWFDDSPHDLYFDVGFRNEPATEYLSLTASGVDTAQFVYAAEEDLLLVPSDVQAFTGIDQNTESIGLIPSGTDTAQYIEPSGIITEQNLTATTAADINDPTSYKAQSFISPFTGRVDKVALKLKKSGSPTDDLIVEVRTDNSNQPSSTILSSTRIAASSLPTSSAFVALDIAENPSLTNGTRYWIVAHRSGTIDLTNYIVLSINTSDPYPNGKMSNSLDSGSSWSPDNVTDAGFQVTSEAFTNIALLALAPSALEEHTTYDADTEALALTASSVDQADFTDTASESLTLSPTGSDILEAAEAASELLALVPSSVDTAQFVD
ncbi:MAG TPA: choice-of-anchor R domain-containing protein, partial [Methylomirabilota bacterium]|nr:choice-of-anchor R domain-containing protein [Methylomirabilota bacterium]